MATEINANNFWTTDLKEIEVALLGKNVDVSSLPTRLDNRVPAQGSVMLDRAKDKKDMLQPATFFERLRARFYN